MKKANTYFLFIFIILVACSTEPEPIHYGEDVCANCKMGIMDHRYGSELVTSKGKVYKFDSIECLAAHIAKNKLQQTGLAHIVVTDYRQPDHFIDASSAVFLQSESFRSPMGLNLTAFSSMEQARSALGEKQGAIMEWPGVTQFVYHNWLKK